MTNDTYYIPPSQEIFDEIKSKAILLWKTYDNTYGYVDEKVGRIEHIKNIKDNCCYIVAMFDVNNQNKLLHLVDGEANIWLQGLITYSMEQCIND